MTEISELKAGVVGTGFIGVVHVDALRRLGVEVLGVVGSTPERAAAKGIADVYESYEALLEDAQGELYRAVHTDVARGGLSDDPDYPTFRDGHVENVLCDAVALSNRERRWWR
jgi:predicted dehydrogenase